MSRAREWAALHTDEAMARQGIPNTPAPSFDFSWINRYPGGGQAAGGDARVDEDGDLFLRCFHGDACLKPGQALALAHWILETFE